MKKTFLKFAYVSAIALTGMMGFSACQSDSAEEVNPNYDPESNSVKTEFAFNISSNAKQKMTGENTQQAGTNFLGMNTMRLFCFNQTPADDKFLGMFDLGSLAASSISSSQSSKIYTMYLPVGTSDFLFYGAWADGAGHENGKLTKTFPTSVTNTTDLSAINFALVPIVANTTDIETPQGTLLTKLNSILTAANASSPNTTWYGTQYLLASGTDAQKAAYKTLAVAYKTFIDKLLIRQASSTTILRSVQDLYNLAKTIHDAAAATPGTTPATQADVEAIASDIVAKITATGLFKVTDNGTKTPKWILAYKDDVDATVKNFPMQQGLPAGAAVLTLKAPGTPVNPTAATEEAKDKFDYSNNGNNVLGQAVTNNIFNITYPSELTYYANSKAIVSDGIHEPGEYPKTVDTWDSWTTTGGTANWKNPGTITATTQAAAMKNNAKYGVAQLESRVVLASYTMTDNAKEITQTKDGVKDYITDVNDQTITFDADDFEWTGVLIGGQADLLKYDFTTNNTSDMNKVIYDNVINTSAITTSISSTPTYTLALDNYLGTGTEQTVNVALEIKNKSGKDFYGIDGIIAAGATFYLVGKLNPANGTGLANAEAWAAAGVYTDADETKTIAHPGYGTNRVFIQDFKTKADFTIPADGLKRAYSSIPDLRSTQILFGLSVDLTWKSGLTFDVNL